MTRKSKGQSASGKTINRMSDASKVKILLEYGKNAQLYNGLPLSAQVNLLTKNLGTIEYLTTGSLANTAKLAGIKIGREPRVYKMKVNPAQQTLELVDDNPDKLNANEIRIVREIIVKYQKDGYEAFGS